jgi:hypothetical protein
VLLCCCAAVSQSRKPKATSGINSAHGNVKTAIVAYHTSTQKIRAEPLLIVIAIGGGARGRCGRCSSSVAGDRIVDQRYVRSASVESATNADCVIAAALRRVPTSARLAILRELYVKHLRIFARRPSCRHRRKAPRRPVHVRVSLRGRPPHQREETARRLAAGETQADVARTCGRLSLQ